MTDGRFVRYHGCDDTPSVLLNWIRSQCVVVRVKRLKVLATCRELWVSGKPSSQSARGVDIPPTTCIWFFWLLGSTGNTCCKGNQEYGFCSRATDVRPAHIGCAYGPAVACGGSDPRVGMKGKRLLGTPCWYSERVS
jgi:hypothetical protein